MKTKVVLCWSGGKDSALAWHRLATDERYEVVALLTTCNEHYDRISMHGVRVELLDRQAAAMGVPVRKVFVSAGGSNEEYQTRMAETLRVLRAEGVTHCAFGDLFLEDLRRWRETWVSALGVTPLFPIWGRDTAARAAEFVALGFRSVICCVNDGWLDETWLGRTIDATFLAALPAGVDPCGENGEYHSFVYAGPGMAAPLRFEIGRSVYRPFETSGGCPLPAPPTALREPRGFWFCDLLPA